MCSVFGYLGLKKSKGLIMQALSRLEYRGYDAAGFACFDKESQRLVYAKAEGNIQNLEREIEKNPIDGNIGLGHTRWASHGGFSLENAHPHFDCTKSIALMHNGIIENHAHLRAQLKDQGHIFHSQTDTEVVAHLFEQKLLSGELTPELIVSVLSQLEGAYALAVMFQQYPNLILAARHKSPLCIGVGIDEYFVASDPYAFADKTNKVIFLGEGCFALVSHAGLKVYAANGVELHPAITTLALDNTQLSKGGHEHYMLKEIFEQKGAIQATVAWLKSFGEDALAQLGISQEELMSVESIHLVGCGTSFYAGQIGRYFFETITGIPTFVHLASEFRYQRFFAPKNSLFIFISQSGETADTLEALRLVSSHRLPTLGLTNVASSSIAREVRGTIVTRAGQEVAVASTKAFTTQVASLYWLAIEMACKRSQLSRAHSDQKVNELLVVSELLENVIHQHKDFVISEFAAILAPLKNVIFLGRHNSYPLAQEAALKLKEISYIFAESYPAGELKHGPLALVDSVTPIIVFSHADPLIYQKLVSNVQEVKARKGYVISFALEGQHELESLSDVTFTIPTIDPLLTPLVMTGLMQFIVYQVALKLGRPIDRPRNLAKSLTIE